MNSRFWAADTFRFAVTGPGIHRFLNRAAAAGVRLRRVQWQKDGCTATACGPDRAKLEKIAADGGWAFAVTARRGPGRRAERLVGTRPGLVAGAVLFLVLLQFLGGFVWCIDFGAMDTGLQPALRTLLADCGIHEGTRLTKPLLQAAQAQALRQSDTFGWISLNFTGGCLSVESTPTQTQEVRTAPPLQGLYAKVEGVILAVVIEICFGAFKVGERVEIGQQLSDAERFERKGNPVPQGAGGRITARVQRQYTAAQPLTVETTIYTGRTDEETTLHLPGITRTAAPETPLAGAQQITWEPLRLGRLALPGCLRRVTTWEQERQTLTYPPDTAAALALRACRAQLLRDFPNAEIEAEQREFSAQDGAETAKVTYIFTANIAQSP